METIYKIFVLTQGDKDLEICSYYGIPQSNLDVVETIKSLRSRQKENNKDVNYLTYRIPSLLYPFTREIFERTDQLMEKYRLMFEHSEEQANKWVLSLPYNEQVNLIRFYEIMKQMMTIKLTQYLSNKQNTWNNDDNNQDDNQQFIVSNLALHGCEGYSMISKMDVELDDYERERYPIFAFWRIRIPTLVQEQEQE